MRPLEVVNAWIWVNKHPATTGMKRDERFIKLSLNSWHKPNDDYDNT